jgi:hypothetical protein
VQVEWSIRVSNPKLCDFSIWYPIFKS